MSSPHVSVIVPVRGDRGEVRHTLQALHDQDGAGLGDIEVLLVDNGDNVGLQAAVDAVGLDARLLVEPTPGSYAARNAAARVAGGEVLAFTDADCRPQPGWLRTGVAALNVTEGECFVGGAIRIEPAAARRASPAELWDMVHGLPQEHYVRREGWAATANLFVRRATFDRVGAFDAALGSGGDREWGWRASRAGVRAIYAPDALVLHPARRSLEALQRKIVRVSEGWADMHAGRAAEAFPTRMLLRSALPFVRSTLRFSRRVRLRRLSRRSQLTYMAVAHWLQYYRLAVQLRLRVAGTRRRAG